jgi:hypothetical protein
MDKSTVLLQQQIAQHIANPIVLSSDLIKERIQGKFKAANRVYNYVLSRKDLEFYPAGNMDSALFSALYLERFDAVAKHPRIGKSNCTYKSYQCGKICLGLRRHCRKNNNDVERVAKIFYLKELEQKTGDTRTSEALQTKAMAGIAEGDRAMVVARAQKMRHSESRGAKAKELINQRSEKRNAKQTQTETGDQRIGAIRPNDGGSNSTGYLQPSSERIKVAREALTQSADPNLIPERLRQHLNEFQVHGAALAIKSMDKQGGFLLADGTGVGKTRQLLAVAQAYADRGQKVVIVTANEVLGSPNPTEWKKGTYTGSFKNDSETMGIKASLIKGDTPMSAGQVHLSTYSNLGKLKGQIDKNTVVLYDEAHAMKNKDSATTKHGKAINDVAGKVLFATATPVDKILHMDYLERANVFSGMSRSQAYKHMGMESVDVRVRGGATIQAWQVPRGKAEQVLEKMSGMFDQMTENGNMIKREISLKGVSTKFTDILVPQEAHDAMQAIEDKLASSTDRDKFKTLIDKRKQLTEAYSKNDGDPAIASEIGRINNQLMDAVDDQGRAQVLMAQRRQIEPYKIPAAVESTNQALKEGKQVVVFLSRVNDSESKDIKGETLATSEGTVKLLREQLIKSGIDPKLITELHGETNTKSADAQAAFQSGKAKIILATIESGGTGINLDDTKGDAPRHMIIMTPPFTAVQNLQAVGRIHRLNTKSESSVEYLFTNTGVDSWSRDITAEKMKTLGSAVAGESGKMSTRTMPHPDLDKTEYKPAPRPPKQITVADPTATAKGLAATIQELHPTITANYWISTDGQKHRVYLEEKGSKTGFIKLDKGNVSFDDVHPSDREQMQAYFEKYQKEGAPKPKVKPIVIEYRYRFGEKLAKKIQDDHASLNAKYWTSPDGSKHRIYLKDNGRDGGYADIKPEGIDTSNVRYGKDDIKKYADELLKSY